MSACFWVLLIAWSIPYLCNLLADYTLFTIGYIFTLQSNDQTVYRFHSVIHSFLNGPALLFNILIIVSYFYDLLYDNWFSTFYVFYSFLIHSSFFTSYYTFLCIFIGNLVYSQLWNDWFLPFWLPFLLFNPLSMSWNFPWNLRKVFILSLLILFLIELQQLSRTTSLL